MLGDGLEHRTVDALFEIFDGIARDLPPAWTTPVIGEATVAVIDALERNGAACELTGHNTSRCTPSPTLRQPLT